MPSPLTKRHAHAHGASREDKPHRTCLSLTARPAPPPSLSRLKCPEERAKGRSSEGIHERARARAQDGGPACHHPPDPCILPLLGSNPLHKLGRARPNVGRSKTPELVTPAELLSRNQPQSLAKFGSTWPNPAQIRSKPPCWSTSVRILLSQSYI